MDNGYEKLIKDLKNLPKVDAPDDFEYKLMVKIQNGQFETAEKEDSSGKLWRFIPATAVALSAVIIFFVVKETSGINQNPYIDGVENPVAMTDTTPDTVNLSGPASPVNDNSYLVIHPNDVIKKEKRTVPQLRLRGVDVDGLIDGSIKNRSGGREQQVVGHGNNRFNGFLVEKDRKEIAELRAKIDSIKTERKKKKIAN
ncbi:MAG: hypothetical protein ACEPO8_03475 [Rhodothermaceae bacterium]